MFLLQILCLSYERQSCKTETELRLSKKSFDNLFLFHAQRYRCTHQRVRSRCAMRRTGAV
jgi:hypothetical protein